MKRIRRRGHGRCTYSFSLTVILSAVVICELGAEVQAAPVTLRFDAIVGPPNTVSPFDVPFNMPFEFHQGDNVRGLITFEPFDAAAGTFSTERIEMNEFRFNIASQSIHTTKFGIQSLNNVGIVEGAGALGVQPGPIDQIRTNCGPLVGNNPVCAPNSVPGRDDILWGFDLVLEGGNQVLTGADFPADPAQWNALNAWRNLSMSFRERDGPGIRRLTAAVGAFSFVPEPNSCAVAVCFAIGSALRIRSRRTLSYSISGSVKEV